MFTPYIKHMTEERLLNRLELVMIANLEAIT
jgi:hypothetical protein